MTHRDDLAATRIVLIDADQEWTQEKLGYPRADAVIAYYKANPDALLDLIRECGGAVAEVVTEGAHAIIAESDEDDPELFNLALSWVEGT